MRGDTVVDDAPGVILAANQPVMPTYLMRGNQAAAGAPEAPVDPVRAEDAER
jgi:hypothetical protein